MKIGYKLTLFFSILSGIVLLLFSFYYYIFIHVALYSVIDKELEYRIKMVIDTFEMEDKGIGSFQTDEDIIQDNWIMILSKNKKILFSSKVAQKLSLDLSAISFNNPYFQQSFMIASITNGFKQIDKKEIYQFKLEPFYKNKELKYYIVSGISIDNTKKTIHLLRTSILIGFFIFIIIISIAGYIFSKYSLKPIHIITQSIGRITSVNLSSRILVSNNGDEIYKLSWAINDLFNRLEKSFHIQKQFISDVSHELKTPLSIIKITLDNILKDQTLPGNLDQKIISLLETVRSMDNLIKKLLLLSRLEEVNSPLTYEDINICLMINNIYEDLLPIADNKNVQFIIDVPKEPVFISADMKLLNIALVNIIENALKYTDQGSVAIRFVKLKDSFQIQIEDTGIGIPEQEIQKVFDRFFRADKSRHDTESFGIGLSIAKKIIDLHHGSIQLNSHFGIGTSVSIYLPDGF